MIEFLYQLVQFVRTFWKVFLILSLWWLLATLFGSWTVGFWLLCGTGFAVLVAGFLGWRKDRLALYADADRDPAPVWRMVFRFLFDVWLSMLLRSAWKRVVPKVKSPTLTSDGAVRRVPRLYGLHSTLDPVLTARFSPGTVAADRDNYIAAADVLTGMLRWPRLFGPRLQRIEIEPTLPGDGVITFHFGDRLSEMLNLVDVPRATLPFHLTYGIRSDGRPAMFNYMQSILIGGLTRRGKSVKVKAMMAYLMAANVPTRFFIGDLKDGIELPEFSKLGRMGKSSCEIAAYATTVGQAEKMLEAMHSEMVSRAQTMIEKGLSQWEPTPEHPLLIGILDETIPLKGKLSVDKPVGKIGYLGASRACALWINSQLGEKSILGELRDLIPQRSCFAVQTYQQTNMVLGDGAHLAGGLSHKLRTKVGIGYSGSDGDAVYLPFRAPNVTRAQAAQLARGIVPDGMLSAKKPRASKVPVKHWLYRAYEDTETFAAEYPNPLAYVGIHSGKDWRKRITQHITAKKGPEFTWCKVHRRVENVWAVHNFRVLAVEVPGDRKDLLAEEKLAIQTEFPAFNYQHNRGGKTVRTLKRWFHRSAIAPDPEPSNEELVSVDGTWSE